MATRRMDWTGAVVFVVLAFGLSWGWLFAVPQLGIPLWTIGFASFGPAVAALLVRGPLLGEGFLQSGIGLRTPPGRTWTYPFALAVPPVVLVLMTALMVVTGRAAYVPGQAYDPLQGQDYFFTLAAQHGPGGLALTFVLSPLFSVVAFGEELGWRGYLFPKLMPLGAPIAMFGSGVVWALWHLPGYMLYGNGGWPGFVAFSVFTTASTPFLCWLRMRARSVWPAAIFHQAYDTQAPAIAGLLAPAAWPAEGLTQAMFGAVTIFELLATGFLFLLGGILRAEREDREIWTDLVAKSA